jgi:hypothetical protein
MTLPREKEGTMFDPEQRHGTRASCRKTTFRAFQALTLLLFVGAMASTARAEVLSLDGQWEIAFDPANEGREARWFEDEVFTGLDARRAITVPSAWELIEEDYEGVAFYRKAFDVPADWKDHVVRLQFGAVNYICEVWLNGEAVGVHEGGFTPFEFRVDRVLKPGEANVLLLRVMGPIFFGDQKVDGIGRLETPQWRGGISGGVWQSVQLYSTGPTYVEDVYLKPDLDGSVELEVELNHTGITGTEATVEFTIVPRDEPSKVVASFEQTLVLRPGKNQQAWTTVIPEARLWSPEDPFLYEGRLTVEIGGDPSDQWTHRFGLREFTIEDKTFVLNGKPIYLKAAFFEGLYPNGIASPDSEEMARKEIRLAQEAGFNMIRPWRRPPAPMWLDLADEMGVLVVGSPALECMALPLSTPYLPVRVENEIREAVLRDRNRTSVVQWELFNELHRPILMQMMRPMALMTRDLDPTRLILDESGGWAYGANIYLPYEHEPTQFNDIHWYSGPFVDEGRYDGYLSIGMTDEEKEAFGFRGRTPGRNVVPGLMSYVSELGYGSLPNLPAVNARFREEGNPLTPAYRYHHRVEADQARVLADSGFGYLYPDPEAFFLEQQSIHGAANKRMIEAVRANPRVKGYCIHALAAGDWILGAGLLDIWREPKTDAYTSTKAANQPRIVSIRVLPRNVYAEEGARLTVTGINELEAVRARLEVGVVSAAGEKVFSEAVSPEWTSGVSSLFGKTMDTAGMRGAYTVVVKAKDDEGRVITENAFEFDVFQQDQLVVPARPVAVLDLDNSLKPHLDRMGVAYAEFDGATPAEVPVFVTSVKPEAGPETERFRDLEGWIKAGGTAVYISGTGVRFDRARSNQIRSVAVPFSADVEHGQGLWSCIPHLVKEHPIFAGLPVDGAMREIYENVWATQTLRNLGGETIVAAVGFQWFSHDHKLHYRGPGGSWWGADLGVVHVGKGRAVVSMMRIVENLGRDPVADRLFYNLVSYVSQ